MKQLDDQPMRRSDEETMKYGDVQTIRLSKKQIKKRLND